MAFLRFNRDKRGYEHFYLVEATTNRRGKTRARVLYWFRTPPNLKIGREPFDEEARRSLESMNPGVTFDWRKIKDTPIPSAETEKWRERRRAEKAEKAARRARAADAAAEPIEPPELGEPEAIDAIEPGEPDEPFEDFESAALDAAEQQADQLAPTEESLVLESATVDPALTVAAPPQPTESGARRKRRRRRRGRRRPADQGAAAAAGEPSAPDEPTE